MADSTQRPIARQGGTHVVFIDLTRALDEGDTITAATVTEVTTTDLTISAATVGAAAHTILGSSAAIGTWIKVTVSGHLASKKLYRLKVVFSTAGGVVNKACREDYLFRVTGA